MKKKAAKKRPSNPIGCAAQRRVWYCTMRKGHQGPHVADDGLDVCAVWWELGEMLYDVIDEEDAAL